VVPKELGREGQFATEELHCGSHVTAQRRRVARREDCGAAVWRIYSQWPEDDNEQKMPKGLAIKP